MSVQPTRCFGIADRAQLCSQMETSSGTDCSSTNSGSFFHTPALLITSRTKQSGAIGLQPVAAEHLSCR